MLAFRLFFSYSLRIMWDNYYYSQNLILLFRSLMPAGQFLLAKAPKEIKNAF